MGDSDFTFCQVAPSLDNDLLELPKIIPDIGDITLTDPVGPKASRDSGSNGLNERGSVAPSTSTKNEKNEQDGAGLNKAVVDPKPTAKKAVARAKVPFEKGFSQMDWLKVTGTHPDLAGLKGQSNRRLISINEVKQHKSEGSIWTVLRGRVYNISPYMKFHPGGVEMLMKAAGKDCTALFNKYHAWVNAEFLLEKCLVGILDESQ